MKTKIFAPLAVMLFMITPTQAFAARMNTYLEGTILHRTNQQVIVQSRQGTYWINLRRPLNYTHRIAGNQIGFWVGMDQIAKFRPHTETAAAAPVKRRPSRNGVTMVADNKVKSAIQRNSKLKPS